MYWPCLCSHLSLNDTYQEMVVCRVFCLFFFFLLLVLKELSNSQTKLQYVPRSRMRVFKIQAVRCVICVPCNNCIVPYIQIRMEYTEFSYHLILPFLTVPGLATELSVLFGMEEMSKYVTAEEAILSYMFWMLLNWFNYPISPEILKVYGNYYISYYDSLIFSNVGIFFNNCIFAEHTYFQGKHNRPKTCMYKVLHNPGILFDLFVFYNVYLSYLITMPHHKRIKIADVVKNVNNVLFLFYKS